MMQRCASRADDELQWFRSCLRWVCMDHSGPGRAALSWLLFLLLAVVVPAAAHFLLAFRASRRPFSAVVQLSLSAASAASFLCLSSSFRRIGLRRLLYLDKVHTKSDRVRLNYTARLSFSFRLLASLVAPCFAAEAAYKTWWYATSADRVPFFANDVLSDVLSCSLEMASWMYRSAIYLLTCVLFRLICHLQGLRLEEFAGLLLVEVEEGRTGVERVLREHLDIRKQLKVISHRFCRFVVVALLIGTGSQLATVLLTTRRDSVNDLLNTSELAMEVSPPPPPQDAWLAEFQRLLPQWKSMRDSSKIMIPISISKVNQFDAARLDVEMSAMLKEQLVKVFSLMKPGLLFQYEPELDAFLEFLIWRFSIWVDKPTPGNALMNLRYRDERAAPITGKEVRTGLEGPDLSVSQKILYCISTVGGQYIWSRLQSFSAFRRWGDSEQRPLARRAWGLVQHAEGLYRAASFFNLLLFLYGGRYKTIVERILKARLVYGSPNMNRAVSFEYMNRQLVWNEFSEMLLLLLPLLNSSSVKKLLLPFSKDKSTSSSGEEADCPICRSSLSIPFIALPCQHRYCYYCLRTRCAATSSYRCARCNEVVVAIQRQGSS